MVFVCVKKSKRKDRQDQIACSIGSWCHCEGKSALFKKLTFLMLPCKIFQPMMPNATFARDPAGLSEQEQSTLTAICQASETARMTYQLVQECATDVAYALRREAC